MNDYSKALPNSWVLKGLNAIFKELSPDETLKKIDMNGCVYVNGERVQSIVCVAQPTNRYFRIDPDCVFVRKRFCVTKGTKTILKAKTRKSAAHN